MRRRILALCCAIGLSCLPGCTGPGGEEPPEGAYRIYYAVPLQEEVGESVGWEYRVPSEPSAQALAELVLSTPVSSDLTAPVRQVRCRSAQVGEDGRVSLDLSEQYGGLSGAELTVANACLTLTLCQLPEVEEVSITVEGEPIPYQSVHVLRESDFLLPGTEEVP